MHPAALNFRKPTSLAWTLFRQRKRPFFKLIEPDLDVTDFRYREPNYDLYLDLPTLDLLRDVPPLLLGHDPVQTEDAAYLDVRWCELHAERPEAEAMYLVLSAAGVALGGAIPQEPTFHVGPGGVMRELFFEAPLEHPSASADAIAAGDRLETARAAMYARLGRLGGDAPPKPIAPSSLEPPGLEPHERLPWYAGEGLLRFEATPDEFVAWVRSKVSLSLPDALRAAIDRRAVQAAAVAPLAAVAPIVAAPPEEEPPISGPMTVRCRYVLERCNRARTRVAREIAEECARRWPSRIKVRFAREKGWCMMFDGDDVTRTFEDVLAKMRPSG